MDAFSKFLLIVDLIFMLLSDFVSNAFISTIGPALMIYVCIRALSRDHMRRYRENQWYLKQKRKVEPTIRKWKRQWQKLQKNMEQRKKYRFYKCPSCKQKVRVPKGKSKIRITCPNCAHQFIKKT